MTPNDKGYKELDQAFNELTKRIKELDHQDKKTEGESSSGIEKDNSCCPFSLYVQASHDLNLSNDDL